MSKVSAIQRRDIDDNFVQLRELENSVNERYVHQYPNLMDEMDNLIEEQKRILSGYDYKMTAHQVEGEEDESDYRHRSFDPSLQRDRPSQTEEHLSDALEDEMQRQIDLHQRMQRSNLSNLYFDYTQIPLMNQRGAMNNEDDFPVEYMVSDNRYPWNAWEENHQVDVKGGMNKMYDHPSYYHNNDEEEEYEQYGGSDRDQFMVNTADYSRREKSNSVLYRSPSVNSMTSSKSSYNGTRSTSRSRRQQDRAMKAQSFKIHSTLKKETIKAYQPMKFISNDHHKSHDKHPGNNKKDHQNTNLSSSTARSTTRLFHPPNSRPSSATPRRPTIETAPQSKLSSRQNEPRALNKPKNRNSSRPSSAKTRKETAPTPSQVRELVDNNPFGMTTSIVRINSNAFRVRSNTPQSRYSNTDD